MLVRLGAFLLFILRQRSDLLSAIEPSAVSVRGSTSMLLSSHENKCTAVLSSFTTASSTFTCYQHHHYRYIRDMSLITGVVLSLFGCTGIGIVTSSFGCEVNRDKQVEALHASHMALFVHGHVYEVGGQP